jgi:hypothetical protein
MIEKERQLADGRGGGGRGRFKAYDGEKAWSFINHSILYVPYPIEYVYAFFKENFIL